MDYSLFKILLIQLNVKMPFKNLVLFVMIFLTFIYYCGIQKVL